MTQNDLGPDDVTVLLAGTKNVAKNETKPLFHSLRRALHQLRDTNVMIFSVPH